MSEPLVQVSGVSKSYQSRVGWFESREFWALRDVTLAISRGQSLGLVGESGSGKTTLARLVLGLELPTSGNVKLKGHPYPTAERQRRHLIARDIQMVFQDPKSSLNPRKTAEHILTAPLAVLTELDPAARRLRAKEVLDLVELGPDTLRKYPHQLSGGQAQRLAIARALGPSPKLVVLDEALSSLDVSVQARLLRLLQRLRDKLDLSYLFIGHDLAVIEVLCQDVLVMYLGSIVEAGTTREILGAPKHPYTRTLLSAVPVIGKPLTALELQGERPSPARIPEGCAFHTRCYRAEQRCSKERPGLSAGKVPHPCACFFAHDSEPPASLRSKA